MSLIVNNIGFKTINYTTTHKYSNNKYANINNGQCSDTFVKNTSAGKIAFGKELVPIKKLLPEYNIKIMKERGSTFYSTQEMLDIINVIKNVGINAAYKVLGHGDESIAFEVEDPTHKFEVFKISQTPVQNYILAMFDKPTDTNFHHIYDDELRHYIVPIQYGLKGLPDGKSQIMILDYGLVHSKLEDDSDEYWCLEEILADAQKAKEYRIKNNLPDMKILEENIGKQ